MWRVHITGWMPGGAAMGMTARFTTRSAQQPQQLCDSARQITENLAIQMSLQFIAG